MTITDDSALRELYDDFAAAHLNPLWTQVGDLMPETPAPRAVPYVWEWSGLLPLAERAGELVPVGRGGERRAIALANPGLGGRPYASPTLWAAIQYLGPHETAPEHRHTQNAFRFVVEGQGVWTVVDGDPVAMRRGDLLLTAGWRLHGHQNVTDAPMAWLDGLDIPFVHYADAGFFEFGPEQLSSSETPDMSRSERLWAHPGLTPLSGLGGHPSSPIAAYRFKHTCRALDEQLALEDEGHPGTVEPGHAAVRYTNPASGGDIMPTIRAEFHRLRPGARTMPRREVGSSVWQVFEGEGKINLPNDSEPAAAGSATGCAREIGRGDLVVVPSWTRYSFEAETSLDLFRFSDAPVMERLGLYRAEAGR